MCVRIATVSGDCVIIIILMFVSPAKGEGTFFYGVKMSGMGEIDPIRSCNNVGLCVKVNVFIEKK